MRNAETILDIIRERGKQKPSWVKRMIARRRKTLVVCRKCHEEIHHGDYSGRKLSV
jgi:AI2M/AI1M-like, HNH endonuclease